MPQFLDTRDHDFEAQFQALLAAKREDSPDVDAVVADIISDVRLRGDEAVLDLTERFDRVRLTTDTLRLSQEEVSQAAARTPQDEREALKLAADRIRAYHQRQIPANESWIDETGAMLGWRWTPMDAAGLYVPGGLASYPSSK